MIAHGGCVRAVCHGVVPRLKITWQRNVVLPLASILGSCIFLGPISVRGPNRLSLVIGRVKNQCPKDLIKAQFYGKCPRCREGTYSIPIRKVLKFSAMHDDCPHCGASFSPERRILLWAML